MKAVDSAPSANKSRSRFGNRNAIKKASRFLPAPNKPAKTISRIKPSTRLDRMAMPTTPVARVLIRRSSTAAIGEQRTASQDLRKKKIYANAVSHSLHESIEKRSGDPSSKPRWKIEKFPRQFKPPGQMPYQRFHAKGFRRVVSAEQKID